MKKIGIIGCGWLGLHIGKHLSNKYEIIATNRTAYNKSELQSLGFKSFEIEFSDTEISNQNVNRSLLSDLDIVIITIPFSAKTDIDKLKNRFQNLSLFLKGFDKQIFLMSSIGVYPQIENEINEDTFDDNQLNPNIFFVENLIKSNFGQTNILRLGGLMGANRVFSNYKITEPYQIVNHIHYQDICFVIEKMIDSCISEKIYNVVAPMHPTKNEIINYQQKIALNSIQETKYRRKILSTKLQKELEYEFIYPNPVKFTEI